MKKRAVSLILFVSLVLAPLTSCARESTSGPSPALEPEPVVYTPELSSPPPNTPAVYEDWKHAFAAAIAERNITYGIFAISLIDIDGDGVPEAVEYITTASRGGRVSRIYGYEKGECKVWYDGEENSDLFDSVFFVNGDDDTLKCIATFNDGGLRDFTFGVYQLVKGIYASGETAIVPVAITKTTCSFYDYHIDLEELMPAVDSVFEAQQELYKQTLLLLGEPDLSVRELYVGTMDFDFTVETLVEQFEKW